MTAPLPTCTWCDGPRVDGKLQHQLGCRALLQRETLTRSLATKPVSMYRGRRM
jgi:hypothetical protein